MIPDTLKSILAAIPAHQHASAAPPPSYLLGAAAVYLFISAYFAWKKERDRAIEAERPKFSPEIYNFVVMRLQGLTDREKRAIKHLSMVTKMGKMQIATQFALHPNGASNIECITNSIIHHDGNDYYSIDDGFREAVKQYFKDNPLS